MSPAMTYRPFELFLGNDACTAMVMEIFILEEDHNYC
jgi:hypothetical protein